MVTVACDTSTSFTGRNDRRVVVSVRLPLPVEHNRSSCSVIVVAVQICRIRKLPLSTGWRLYSVASFGLRAKIIILFYSVSFAPSLTALTHLADFAEILLRLPLTTVAVQNRNCVYDF